MTVRNVTPLNSIHPQRQGAVIHSVAHLQEYRAHYGVQSATFIQTVSPGQTSGTYRLNGMIPYWRGAQMTAAGASPLSTSRTISSPSSTGRAAGSPPVPYPPRNASAYFAEAANRIIPNTSFRIYG